MVFFLRVDFFAVFRRRVAFFRVVFFAVFRRRVVRFFDVAFLRRRVAFFLAGMITTSSHGVCKLQTYYYIHVQIALNEMFPLH